MTDPERVGLLAIPLKKAVLLRALFCNAGQLRAGLLELGSARGNASFQFAYALGVAALAGGGAFQLDCGFIGAALRFVSVAVKLIASLGERVLAGFKRADLLGGGVDVL